MTGKYIQAAIKPSRRVQIVKTDDHGPHPYWRPGQFGHAVSYSTHPGMYTESGPSKGGDLSYLVSKSKDGHTGATWFSAQALRFTGKEKAPSQSHARKKYLRRLRNHATRGKHTIYDLVEVNKRTKKERVLHEHFSTKADAQEAAGEYKARKRPDVTYRIKPWKITAPAYRRNPED